MNINDFINSIENQTIDTDFINKLEAQYGIKVNDYVGRLLSVEPDGVCFDGDDILRLLSHEEILDASDDLDTDFAELKIIPVFDSGDNDFVSFDAANENWCKFNIVDSVKFREKKNLAEVLRI